MEQERKTQTTPEKDTTSKVIIGVLALLALAGIAYALWNAMDTVDTNQNTLSQENNTTMENDADSAMDNQAEDTTDEQTDEMMQETQAQLQARADAQARLRELEANVQNSTAQEETLEAIIATRASLKTAYENAEGEVQEEWQALDDDLARLEGEIRNNTATAIDTFQGILERLETDVRTDENPDQDDAMMESEPQTQ